MGPGDATGNRRQRIIGSGEIVTRDGEWRMERMRHHRLAGALAGLLLACPSATAGQVLFSDAFEGGLASWRFLHGRGYELVETGDPGHGRALSLRTLRLPVYALIEGSGMWGDVRIEGSVLFPESVQNYLGFIYRFRDDGRRSDFGGLYIKGNGSYVRANPRFDTNVGRALYEERRTPLDGPAHVEIGRWTPFALEVVGREAHLYVGDLSTPRFTLPFGAPEGPGAFGFEPRNPGGAVWIDDVVVRSIDGFSYRGAPIPSVAYAPERLVTRWDVLGPLTAMVEEVETGPFDPDFTASDDGRTVRWRPFETDPRGAVVTAGVTEQRGPRRVAYFHGVVDSPTDGTGHLAISSVDDLALWVNGEFLGFVGREDAAWWDVEENPDHPGATSSISLRAGQNDLLVRVVGGVYASGGFFLRVSPGQTPSGEPGGSTPPGASGAGPNR